MEAIRRARTREKGVVRTRRPTKRPEVLDEFATLELVRIYHLSLARFGDGEFKLMWGRKQISQRRSLKMAKHLRRVLKVRGYSRLLVGVPNIWDKVSWGAMTDRKKRFWRTYRGGAVTDLFNGNKTYASAFVTRPDSAPWIDIPAYWDGWLDLWKGKRVLLVQGKGNRFNKAGILNGASHLTTYDGPLVNAYDHYRDLLRAVRKRFAEARADLAVLSLGPTATLLAADLSLKGIWALDMGHFGMFWAKDHHSQGGEGRDVRIEEEEGG